MNIIRKSNPSSSNDGHMPDRDQLSGLRRGSNPGYQENYTLPL